MKNKALLFGVGATALLALRSVLNQKKKDNNTTPLGSGIDAHNTASKSTSNFFNTNETNIDYYASILESTSADQAQQDLERYYEQQRRNQEDLERYYEQQRRNQEDLERHYEQQAQAQADSDAAYYRQQQAQADSDAAYYRQQQNY